jgi:hypothetical protein
VAGTTWAVHAHNFGADLKQEPLDMSKTTGTEQQTLLNLLVASIVPGSFRPTNHRRLPVLGAALERLSKRDKALKLAMIDVCTYSVR